MTPDLREIGKHFEIPGDFLEAVPLGAGHINDTFLASYNFEGAAFRYTQQRINTNIFDDTDAVMENIARVTEHLAARLEAAGVADIGRRAVAVVPATDGTPCYHDPGGNCWRTYRFIEGARTSETIASKAEAYAAAKMFGEFQKLLADLPPPRLHETIPDFHNTPKRYHALVAAIEADTCNRATAAREEIEFALNNCASAGLLLDAHARGDITERITHNDTKINNILFDEETNEALCVIDLDTVMPGLGLYDFGDLVRTSTSPAAEDEQDLTKVNMQLPLFDALVHGYLDATAEVLTEVEEDLLPDSGRPITLETGIRFLTDHLAGDAYFKTHRPNHNLDRCRTQFALIRSMDEQWGEMESVVSGQ